jgi:hypothetical protein
MKFPQRINYLARMRKERNIRSAIGATIGRKCHMSTRESVKQQLPYIRFVFQKNPTEAASMTKYFGFDEEMIGYLAGTEKRASKIISQIGVAVE